MTDVIARPHLLLVPNHRGAEVEAPSIQHPHRFGDLGWRRPHEQDRVLRGDAGDIERANVFVRFRRVVVFDRTAVAARAFVAPRRIGVEKREGAA